MAGCRREACDHQSSLSGDSHVRLYRSFVVAGDLLESLRTRIVVLETDSCQARFLLIIKRVPGYLSVTWFPPTRNAGSGRGARTEPLWIGRSPVKVGRGFEGLEGAGERGGLCASQDAVKSVRVCSLR